MKTILVLILNIIIYSPSITAQDCSANQIICEIAGYFWISSYVFNVNEIPERCDIFLIGQFAFDRHDGTDIHVMEGDKNIIKSLTKINKPVYVSVGFQATDDWDSVLCPQDPDEFKKQSFDPLISFLNTYNITGIIINCIDLYTGVENFSQKIFDFVTSIKKEINQLKVGLVVDGVGYVYFTDKTLFDFTMTNEILDFYSIDLTILNSCDEETKQLGLSPVKSTNPTMSTIETVTNAINNSTIDTSKIYAMLQVSAIIPASLARKGEIRLTSYVKYCSNTDSNSCQWCSNPSQVSYDQGVYAKQFFRGIILRQLDTDDYDCSCECGKFPVTNQIINGWKSSSFTSCPKLD